MKKYFLLLAGILIINICKAQTYDTTTYYGKMNFIFNNISHTQITTGLLRDYGIDFLSLDDYTGKVLNDSNYVTLTDWRSLYVTLYSGQINTPANMLYLDTINRRISKYALSNLPVSFACLYYNYNVLDSNAVTKNLMYIQNGQIYDVANRTQSPYLLQSTFAIAPTQQTVPVGSNQLILRPELFLSNTGKTISGLQIDPKGTGAYQTVNFNTPFTVNYATAGLYTVNFKITYTDGTINYSHTKLGAVSYDDGGLAGVFNRKSDIHITGYGPPYVEEPFIFGTKGGTSYSDQSAYYAAHVVNFTADKQYLGIAAQGDYTIDLSVNNTSGAIKKPLIVISGFDPEAKNDSTGMLYYNNFVQRIKYDWNNGSPIPLNGSNGLDNADSFDIVYLHWHNGTDYIERNAYLLERLIKIVDSIKAANGSTEKNVIMGTSMGGLVARWALRDMEINNIPHDTRLFISDDAPHWGANVPPAYQAMVQYIAPWQIINLGWASRFPYVSISWSDMFPDAINGVNIFNSPAAKQMLIQRYVLTGQLLTADNSMHTSFMNEINNMGWPLNCRNVVLSNGTCNGTTIFNDNSKMLDISGNQKWSYFGSLWRSFVMTFGGSNPPLLGIIAPGVPVRDLSLLVQFPLSLISTKRTLDFDFGAWAVPATGTSLIFKGDVSIQRQLLKIFNTTSYILKCHVNSTSDMLPLDNDPGSKYDIAEFGVDIDSVNAQLHAQLGNWINATLLQKSFCFVPTVSSLALNNAQQNLRASLCSNIPCLLPAHVADYYAPQQNQIHISYTTDNSNWILQEQAVNFSCITICPSNVSISGDNNFCTTSSPYIITTFPPGATVYWQATPSGIATINTPDSTQSTLTKTGNGVITLSANITNACVPTTLTKTITVGTPAIPTIYAKRVGATCYYDAAVDLNGQGTIVEFSLNNTTWTPGTLIGNTYTAGYELLGPANKLVYARTSNSCGKGSVYSKTIAIPAPPKPCAYIANRTSSIKDSGNVSNSIDAINESTSNSSNIHVYPNPADKKLVIELPVLSQNTQANIYNNEGKLMLSQKLYNKTSQVDISNFRAGVYLIRVLTDNGNVSTLKIIKE